MNKKIYIVLPLSIFVAAIALVLFIPKAPNYQISISRNEDSPVLFEQKDMKRNEEFDITNASFSTIASKQEITKANIGDAIELRFEGDLRPKDITVEQDILSDDGVNVFSSKATDKIQLHADTSRHVSFRVEDLSASYLSSNSEVKGDKRGVRFNCTWEDGKKTVLYFMLEVPTAV